MLILHYSELVQSLQLDTFQESQVANWQLHCSSSADLQSPWLIARLVSY